MSGYRTLLVALLLPGGLLAACDLVQSGQQPAEAGIDATTDVVILPDSGQDVVVPDAPPDAPPDVAPQFSPSDLAGMELWLIGDRGVVLDDGGSGGVVAWLDQSGKNDPARNAMAFDKDATPELVTDAGRPAVGFRGGMLATDKWDGGPFAQPFTVFIVITKTTPVSPTSTYVYDSLSPVAQTALMVIGPTGDLRGYAGAFTPSAGVASGTMAIVATYNGNASRLLKNANPSDASPPGPGGFNGFAGLTLGTYAGRDPSFAFGGTIAELAVYSRSLTDTEVKSLNGYAAGRYGVTIK